MSVFKVFSPEIFQGNLKKTHYFEGWYHKHVSHGLHEVYSFIPGVSLTKEDPHCFIQIIHGISAKTYYIRYPLEDFTFDKNNYRVEIAGSSFSSARMDLDISDSSIRIKGVLNYSYQIRYPNFIFSPGIMGWYSFVPFMECKHAVVSVNHILEGKLKINDKFIDFTGGKGYIEKDWGTSFPSDWLWMQCNNFSSTEASLMLSIARIPWLGSYFIGFLCFLYLNKSFYLFNTYNKSRLLKSGEDQERLSLELKNKNSRLVIKIDTKKYGNLVAPKHGKMKRMIKESIDSECEVFLYDKSGNLLFNEKGKRAGLEIMENILNMI